jgi:hypothetical protein
MDLKFQKNDAIIFIVAFGVLYIGMNVYNKEKSIDPNYRKSLQIAIIGALIAVFLQKMYSKNVKNELKLEEPFNSSP